MVNLITYLELCSEAAYLGEVASLDKYKDKYNRWTISADGHGSGHAIRNLI